MTTATTKTAAAKKTAAPKAKPALDVEESAFAMSTAAQDQFESMFKVMNESAEEMQGRTQELFDATRESLEVAQSKLQEVNAEALEAARTEMTEAVDFANDLTKAKTLTDAMEIQRDYWTHFFEGRMQRTRAMTDVTMEAMRGAAEPVNKTMQGAFSKTGFEAFFPFAAK